MLARLPHSSWNGLTGQAEVSRQTQVGTAVSSVYAGLQSTLGQPQLLHSSENHGISCFIPQAHMPALSLRQGLST